MKGAYAGNEREANDHSGRISPSPHKIKTISYLCLKERFCHKSSSW